MCKRFKVCCKVLAKLSCCGVLVFVLWDVIDVMAVPRAVEDSDGRDIALQYPTFSMFSAICSLGNTVIFIHKANKGLLDY